MQGALKVKSSSENKINKDDKQNYWVYGFITLPKIIIIKSVPSRKPIINAIMNIII